MTDHHTPSFAKLQEDLARSQDFRQREMLYGPIEDPSIPRRRLYVPEILSGVGAVMCIAFVLHVLLKW